VDGYARYPSVSTDFPESYPQMLDAFEKEINLG
jgi:hypothetical protein